MGRAIIFHLGKVKLSNPVIIQLRLSSDFLFRRFLSLTNLIIGFFCKANNRAGILPRTLNAIKYLMVKLTLLRLNLQIYLVNLVVISYVSCVKYPVLFLDLFLTDVSAKPKQNFLSLFASLETSVL